MADSNAPATITYNMDIETLHAKHLRIKMEVEKCQSSNLADLKTFDLTRIHSYITDLKAKLNQIISQPEMDLPDFSPRQYPLEPYGMNQALDNELLVDFLKYLEAVDFELINSQSSRHSTSLMAHDLGRYQAGIRKLEEQLAYAEGVKPLDRPESSPKVAMTGTGNVGV